MDKFVRKPGIPQKILGGSLAGELEYVDALRPAKRSDAVVVGQPPTANPGGVAAESSEKMRIAQNFAVSCVSASLAHVPHHPLYTLKSQMMFHGNQFSLRKFLSMMWESRGAFLMRGIIGTIFIAVLHKAVIMLLQVSQ